MGVAIARSLRVATDLVEKMAVRSIERVTQYGDISDTFRYDEVLTDTMLVCYEIMFRLLQKLVLLCPFPFPKWDLNAASARVAVHLAPVQNCILASMIYEISTRAFMKMKEIDQ